MAEALTLTDEQVLENAHTTLAEHLECKASGYTCSTSDLLNVLLGVASDQGTIQSVCANLVGSPNPQTIRNYINKQITVEELPKLEEGLNKALVAQLPARVWRHARDIAMDFHDRLHDRKAGARRSSMGTGQSQKWSHPLLPYCDFLCHYQRIALYFEYSLCVTRRYDFGCCPITT